LRKPDRLIGVKPPNTYPIAEDTDELPDVEADAVAWVIRLTSGDASAADRAAFEVWRDQSPAHEAALVEARKLWLGLGDVLPAPVVATPAASDRIEPAPRSWRRPRLASGLAVSAAIALLVATGFQYVNNWQHDYVTAAGQRKVVALADGTRVQLSSGSAIDVELGSNARRVRLVRGEAYFDVVHDAERPFVVDAGKEAVRDIGTAFSVRLDGDDGVVVVVERGVVEVTGSAAAVKLMPNQRIRTGKSRNARVEPANLSEDLAWTSGRLILEDRSLREVVDELNRYYGSNVVLLGSEIASRRINAVVDLEHIDDWLDALRDSQSVSVTRLPGFVVLF
jgi:transmembrane sensor